MLIGAIDILQDKVNCNVFDIKAVILDLQSIYYGLAFLMLHGLGDRESHYVGSSFVFSPVLAVMREIQEKLSVMPYISIQSIQEMYVSCWHITTLCVTFSYDFSGFTII